MIKSLLCLVQKSDGLFKKYYEYYKLQADHCFRQKNIVDLHNKIAHINFGPLLMKCGSRTRYLSVLEKANRKLTEERMLNEKASEPVPSLPPIILPNDEDDKPAQEGQSENAIIEQLTLDGQDKDKDEVKD